MDQGFLIRLFVVIGIIWLTQFLLTELSIREPAHKIILVVVLVIGIIWLATGGVMPALR